MAKLINVIQDLVDHIETNLEFEVNIVDLANNYEISPYHFQRLFKVLVGDSLGQYIRGRRLTKAAEMLTNSKDGLIDIAIAVGFNSHEAFTRSFKSYFEVSPKEFRLNKPPVILARKPVLTVDLFNYVKEGLQREPDIITFPAQHVVGTKMRVHSPFILEEQFCKQVDDNWQVLASRLSEVKSSVPGTYYGITLSESGNFTEEYVDYICAIPVADFTNVPEGLATHTLPERKLALFENYDHKDDRFKKTIDYIYGYWLPNSGCKRGPGADYVLVEKMMEFGKPGHVKYALPVC
jgi:AraC family transcriptional regulator